jgi:DNA mismatch endonuclease (patch repair protein)
LLRCNRISGWKIREAAITGKPDFYFPEHRIAVFIDGCFWHGCPKCFKAPKQNALFWKEKIGRNRKRDLFVRRRLKSDGITVVRLWEHEIEKKAGTVAKVIARLRTHLDL